jgi:uncharacterized protein with GYD domain
MTTYVTLADFTREAIQHVSDSPEVIDFLEETAEDLGGDLRDVYVTLGQYDVVVVSEFPDDESYAQFALIVGNQGGLSTETLRAFTEAEYGDVVEGVVTAKQPLIWGDT